MHLSLLLIAAALSLLQVAAGYGCIQSRFSEGKLCAQALAICTAGKHDSGRCKAAVKSCGVNLFQCRCGGSTKLQHCLVSMDVEGFLSPIDQTCFNGGWAPCNSYLRNYAGYIQRCPC